MRIFSFEQFTHLQETVILALTEAIETLIDKAGPNQGENVAQLLIHLYMHKDYTTLNESILAGINDREISSAISHICSRLTATVKDLSARQLARPVVGQDYESAALTQLVRNFTLSYLEKTIKELSSHTHDSQRKDGAYVFSLDTNPSMIERMITNISPADHTCHESPISHTTRPVFQQPNFIRHRFNPRAQRTATIQRQNPPLAPQPRQHEHRFFRALPHTTTQTEQTCYRICIITNLENGYSLHRLLMKLFNAMYQSLSPNNNPHAPYQPYIFCLNSRRTCVIECITLNDQAHLVRASNRTTDLFVLYHPLPQEAAHQVHRVNVLHIQNKLALLSQGAPDHHNFHTPHRFIAHPRQPIELNTAEAFLESLIRESERLKAMHAHANATMNIFQIG